MDEQTFTSSHHSFIRSFLSFFAIFFFFVLPLLPLWFLLISLLPLSSLDFSPSHNAEEVS